MKFLKDNSYDIIKLCVNQIGIAIFSLFLYTAVGAIDDKSLKLKLTVIVSVFAIGFYFVLLYTMAWELGAKDKIRVDSGRQLPTKSKGVLMALVANAPTVLFALVSIVFIAIYMKYGTEWCYTVFGIFNLILRFVAAMYIGVLQGVFSAFDSNTMLNFLLDSVGFAILPFMAMLATHLGYMLGFKEKRIFPAFKKSANSK